MLKITFSTAVFLLFPLSIFGQQDDSLTELSENPLNQILLYLDAKDLNTLRQVNKAFCSILRPEGKVIQNLVKRSKYRVTIGNNAEGNEVVFFDYFLNNWRRNKAICIHNAEDLAIERPKDFFRIVSHVLSKATSDLSDSSSFINFIANEANDLYKDFFKVDQLVKKSFTAGTDSDKLAELYILVLFWDKMILNVCNHCLIFGRTDRLSVAGNRIGLDFIGHNLKDFALTIFNHLWEESWELDDHSDRSWLKVELKVGSIIEESLHNLQTNIHDFDISDESVEHAIVDYIFMFYQLGYLAKRHSAEGLALHKVISSSISQKIGDFPAEIYLNILDIPNRDDRNLVNFQLMLFKKVLNNLDDINM